LFNVQYWRYTVRCIEYVCAL